MKHTRFIIATAAVAFLLASCAGSSDGGDDATVSPDALGDAATPQLDVLGDAGSDVKPPPRDTRDDDTDVSTESCDGLDELLAEAKQLLEQGQSYMAYDAYRDAEALCPSSPEARFGAALSGMIDAIELGLSLVSVVNQALITDPPDVQSQDDWAAETLHDAMVYLAGRFRDSLVRLDDLADAEIRMEFGKVPVYNTNRTMLVYRGEFDTGDVHLMRSIAQGLVLFFDVFVAQDFRADVMTLVPIVRSFDGDVAEMALLVLGHVLTAGPQALGVHPEDGEEAFNEAGRMLASLGGSLDAALRWLREEEGDSAKQVSYLQPASTEQTALLVVQAKCTYTGDGLLEPTLGDLIFRIPMELQQALDDMATSVETPGSYVRWEDGPVWLLAVMANMIFQTGVIGDIDLGGLTLPLDRMDIKALADTIKNLIPLPFAFDFGAMFARPTGLRAFLPAPSPSGDGVLMDWECPTETADDGFPNGSGALLCDSADALVDSGHFVGTEEEIEADGVLSGLPYLGFMDPTWNGLLLANEVAIGLSEEEGFKAATQRSINAGLAVGLKPILDLIIR